VEQEADKRMDDVAELNKEIAKLEYLDPLKSTRTVANLYRRGQIDHAKDAEAHAPDYKSSSDDNSSEESSEVEESDEDEYDDDNYEEDKEDEEDESRVEAEVDTSD
jgi:U3 small nucleolar RNA-associated protein 14